MATQRIDKEIVSKRSLKKTILKYSDILLKTDNHNNFDPENILYALKIANTCFANLLEHRYKKSTQQQRRLKPFLESVTEEIEVLQYMLRLATNCQVEKINNNPLNIQEIIEQVIKYFSIDKINKCCSFTIRYAYIMPGTIFGDQTRVFFIILKIMKYLLHNVIEGRMTLQINGDPLLIKNNQKTKKALFKSRIEIIFKSEGKVITRNYFEKVVAQFHKDYNDISTENSLTTLRRFITELNANLQFCIIDNDSEIEFNNNENTRQEANNKQKGCQLKLSLPVVIDATDRSFSLNNEKTQGEVEC